MNPIRENRLSERIQSVFVLFIMVSSLVTGLGISLIANAPTAVAATTGSIVCSCDGNSGNFWGNQTIYIQVTDPDINTDKSPSPLVRIRNATGINLGLNMTQATDGTWYAFIGNYSLVGSAHSSRSIKGPIGMTTAKHIGGVTRDLIGTSATYVGYVTPTAGAPGHKVHGTGSPKVVNATTYILNAPTPMGGRYNTSDGGLDNSGDRIIFVAPYSTLRWPFVQLFNLSSRVGTAQHPAKSSDTFTVEYVDTSGSAGGTVSVTKTINYQATKATVSNDRTSIPPGATLRLAVTAPTWNRDPTTADTFGKFSAGFNRLGGINSSDGRGVQSGGYFDAKFTLTTSDSTASGTTTQLLIESTKNTTSKYDTRIKLNFTETGTNTNVFEAFLNLGSLRAAGSSVRGVPYVVAAGDLISFSFNDFNSSRTSQLGADNQTVTLSALTFSKSTGSLSLSSSALPFTDGMSFDITDADRNNDTRTKENITAIIRLNWTSSLSQGDEARLFLNETDKNSGIFRGLLRVQPTTDRTISNNSLVSGGLGGAGDAAIVPGAVYRFARFNSTNPAIRLTAWLRTVQITSASQDPRNTRADFNITYVDPFPTTSTLNRAITTISVTKTQATIALDKSAYNPPTGTYPNVVGGDTATLTITEPDANLDSTSVESLRITRQATGATRAYDTLNQTSARLTKIGRMEIIRIRSNTETRVPIDGLATETGANTGIFTVSFNLTTGGFQAQFQSGDTLRVRYFDEPNGATATNATATIGGTLGVLKLDRTEIPMAAALIPTSTTDLTRIQLKSQKVNVTITLLDADQNASPNAIEQVIVHIVVLNATSGAANYTTGSAASSTGCPTLGTTYPMGGGTKENCQQARWYNQTLTETGTNTGNFTAKIQFLFHAADGTAATYMYNSTGRRLLDRTRDMINGQLQVFVNDTLGTSTLPTIGGVVGSPNGATGSTKAVKATANFVAHTGTISVDKTSAGMGETVKVTVTDPDLNLDVTAKDTPTFVWAQYFNDTAFLVAGGPAESTLRLSETDVNTGVFSTTFTVGTVESTRTGLQNAYPGVYIRFRYVDAISASGLYSIGLGDLNIDTSIRVKSNTATVNLDKTAYGPFQSMNVTVYDPDLKFNKTNVVLTKVRASVSGDEIVNMLPSNVYSNSTFVWKIPLARAPDTAVSTTNLRLEVNATDTIFVFHTDLADASGAPRIVQATATVGTADGVVTLDKANYLVGEFITVSITDNDANRVTTARDSVTVLVTTTSYPAGTNITLQETDVDTGKFTGQVQIISTLPGGGQVLGATGDTITVKYIDQLGTGAGKKNIFATAKVGTAVPKTQQAPAGVPALVDSSGNALTTIKAGDLTNIQATVKNNITTSLTITYLVQVKDDKGAIVQLSWAKDLTLPAGTSFAPSQSWIPAKAGTYTVEVFVWDGLTTAVALSPSQKITVTVG